MDNVHFLDELFGDPPRHPTAHAGEDSDEQPLHGSGDLCFNGALFCDQQNSRSKQAAVEEEHNSDAVKISVGNDDSALPDLPSLTHSPPYVRKATGSTSSACAKFPLRANPVNVAIQDKNASPTPSKRHVNFTADTKPLGVDANSSPLTTGTHAKSILKTPLHFQSPAEASLIASAMPSPIAAAPPAKQQQTQQSTPIIAVLEENAALRASVDLLTSQVKQLTAQLAQKSQNEAATAALLEENTAYMSSLKDTIAREQATRVAVEERCQENETVCKEAQADMEAIQEELKRRLSEAALSCAEAEAKAKEGSKATAELHRLRAAVAFDSEVHKKLEEDFDREVRERERATLAEAALRERVEALETMVDGQRKQHEAATTAFEQERTEAQLQREKLQQEVQQAQRRCRTSLEQHALYAMSLDALLGWFERAASEPHCDEGTDSDAVLTETLSHANLVEQLQVETRRTSADATSENALPLSNCTLFHLEELRERVLGTIHQWRRLQAREGQDRQRILHTAFAQVTALIASTERKLQTALQHTDKRLNSAQESVEACLRVANGRQQELLAAAERARTQSAELEALQAALSLEKVGRDDSQRRLRLQKTELRGVQKHCAILQDQLRLQAEFEGTTVALRDLRLLSARELRAAVGDLIDVTRGIGGSAANFLAVPSVCDEDDEGMMSKRDAFVDIIRRTAMKTEAHVELIHKTIGKSVRRRRESVGVAPIRVTSRSPTPPPSPSQRRHSRVHFNLSESKPSPSPCQGEQMMDRQPTANADERQQDGATLKDNMTPRQRAVYDEMQRLIRSPPSPRAAAGAADQFLSYQQLQRQHSFSGVHSNRSGAHYVGAREGSGESGRGSALPLASYPSDEQFRLLKAEEHLCETAETLGGQLQNLSSLVENSASQCDRHTVAVTAAIQSWECRIAEGLEQCARAIEERISRQFLAALSAPQRLLAAEKGEEAAALPPPDSTQARPAGLTAVDSADKRELQAEGQEGERPRQSRTPRDLADERASPLIRPLSVVREDGPAVTQPPHTSGSSSPAPVNVITSFSGSSPWPTPSAAACRRSLSPPHRLTFISSQQNGSSGCPRQRRQSQTPVQPASSPHAPDSTACAPLTMLALSVPALGQHHFRFREGSSRQEPSSIFAGCDDHDDDNDEDVAGSRQFLPRTGRSPRRPALTQFRRPLSPQPLRASPLSLHFPVSPSRTTPHEAAASLLSGTKETPSPPPQLSLAEALSGKRAPSPLLRSRDPVHSVAETPAGEENATAQCEAEAVVDARDACAKEEEPLTPTSAIVFGHRTL